MQLRISFVLAACVLLSRLVSADTSPIPAADYTVARSWRLAGNGGWEYLALEGGGDRLFVTRDDHVDVIETESGRLAGTVPRTTGVRGVAFAPALKRGFTSNSRTNTVTVFELETLRVTHEVPISGGGPDAILYEPKHNYIVTANRETANLSLLDAGSLQIVGTVPLPGRPEYMVAEGDGRIFVNMDLAPGKLVVVDAKTFAVKAKWTLKDCANPSGLALDAVNHRLFSVCANQVMAVTDSVSGKSIARVIIGRGSDGVAFDPDLSMVFSSNGIDGTLTVIHQDDPDEYRVGATVTTQLSARTLALDPASHRIYLAAADFGPTPAATADQPLPRANVIPGTFVILVAQPR